MESSKSEQDAGETFAIENSGTARFVGNELNMCKEAGTAAAGGGPSTSGTKNAAHEFQTMKPGNGQKSNATGRAAHIPHSELVKMLYYLEGELQARDVVIAALRNERLKQYLCDLRTKRMEPNDPYAAIFRDKVIMGGSLVSREASTQAATADLEVRQIIEQQMEQQYQMVNKQRATHMRMVSILKESLENNQRMLQELEEEKRKHEHDTAQGDDITYGLELERTKLRQELEDERATVKKMDKDMKKLQETLDFERNRQKQIVLLLIAERKKILMKYIEEGKRSEDLAQILAEEKQRSDTIADGLEEESKKSLRMEEEMEKQAAAFEIERKTFKVNLLKEEKRVKELEQELALLRSENELLKVQHQQQQQQLQQANSNAAAATAAGKPRVFNEGCASSMVNIAKIVQPTATVSSVPVSGPTTGIARSIAPGQNIRSGIASAVSNASMLAVASSSEAVAAVTLVAATTSVHSMPPAPSPAKMQPTATIQRAPGGVKYSALVAAHSIDQSPGSHAVPIAVPPVTVPPAGARGVPPPIPPNKPIVPPKREPSLSRLGSLTAAAAAAASMVAGSSNTATTANANTNANSSASATVTATNLNAKLNN